MLEALRTGIRSLPSFTPDAQQNHENRGIPIFQSKPGAASYIQVLHFTAVSIGSACFKFQFRSDGSSQPPIESRVPTGATVFMNGGNKENITLTSHVNEMITRSAILDCQDTETDKLQCFPAVQTFYNDPTGFRAVNAGNGPSQTGFEASNSSLFGSSDAAMSLRPFAAVEPRSGVRVDPSVEPYLSGLPQTEDTVQVTEQSDIPHRTPTTLLNKREAGRGIEAHYTRGSINRGGQEMLQRSKNSQSTPSDPQTLSISHSGGDRREGLDQGTANDSPDIHNAERARYSETESEPPRKRTRLNKTYSHRALKQLHKKSLYLKEAESRSSPTILVEISNNKGKNIGRTQTKDSTTSIDSTIHLTAPSTNPRKSMPAAPSTKTRYSQSTTDSYKPLTSQRSPTATPTTKPRWLKIFFTSSTHVDESKTIMRTLVQAGLKKVDRVANCDFICVGKRAELKKTSHLILALSSGKAPITDEWARESAAAKKLLEPADFLATDPVREAQWGITVTEAVQRGKQGRKPLAGMTILFTASTKSELGTSSFEELKEIAIHGGAKAVQSCVPRTRNDGHATVVVSYPEDPSLPALLEEGWICYSKDIVTLTVLRGELRLHEVEFVVRPVDEGREMRERKVKRSKKGG